MFFVLLMVLKKNRGGRSILNKHIIEGKARTDRALLREPKYQNIDGRIVEITSPPYINSGG